MGYFMSLDNILDNLGKHKGKILLFSLIFIVFIITVSLLTNILENSNNKKSLEKALVSLGERVYEEAYYDNLKKEHSEYEENGIKITLAKMFEIIDLEVSDYFYNRRTKETCDIKNSYVKIYPIAPYGVKDYIIEHTLECGY